jgi:hypothetical protein
MPVVLDRLTVNGRVVMPGMEVTLRARPGLLPGRYEVRWIEHGSGGDLLVVWGRLRRRETPHLRYVRPGQVKTVHVRTR